MFVKLGTKLFKSVQKAYPISTNGQSLMAKNVKFDIKNPYILEVLPEERIDELCIFNGKKLKTVCSILDNDNYIDIKNRYKKLLPEISKGFSDDELNSLYKKAFPNIKIPTDVNCDAFVLLNNLSPEIGSKFDAHGIAKISITDHLRQLNKLLTDGINPDKPFYTAPLVAKGNVGAGIGTANGSAYRDGSFILVSDKSNKLCKNGIKHVIVNDAYYNIISDLQKKFPNVNFVRADNAVEYFSNL